MYNWSINIFHLAISLIPYFLRKLGENIVWVTEEELIWATENFKGWGYDGSGRHVDWVSSLVSPVQSINNEFAALTVRIYYKLHITGQVIYLEHYLNDLFDPDDRGIKIADDALTLAPFLYKKIDTIPPGDELYLYPDTDPIYLYNQIEYFSQGSFVIYVPGYLPLNSEFENRIRAAVNYYKQAGVTYKVQNY